MFEMLNSSSKNQLIAVIIINWNGLAETVKCLNSALNLSYPNFQVIVVDNGSKNNEAKALEEKYKERIHVLRITTNNGYSAGINHGIRYVINKMPDVEYCLISNNDVVFKPDYLGKIVDFMDVNPKVGVAAGITLSMQNPGIIESIGQKWNLQTGFVRNIGSGSKLSKEILRIRETDFVLGAVFMLKLTLIKKIGLLDEGYFLYFEEPDYCMRAKNAGYKTFLVPSALAYHKSRGSVQKVNQFAMYCYTKSRFRFIIKHIDSKYLLSALFINIAFTLTNSYGSCIRKQEPRLFLYTLKAIWENLLEAKNIRTMHLKRLS
jgi:GT2 family glycosyltransferase